MMPDKTTSSTASGGDPTFAAPLPVILPSVDANFGPPVSASGLGWMIGVVGFLVLAVFLGSLAYGDSLNVATALFKWTPLMFLGPGGQTGGFVLNVLVSVVSMALGTSLGLILGLGQLSPQTVVAKLSNWITQFFRNSPWLVILFYFMLLLPYSIRVGGTDIAVQGWLKASLAFALPIMANVAEIVRGAVRSIPHGQWESAESLAFTRAQTLRMIILPQCVKRMIPPLMNWYAILLMATPMMSILGVSEAMTLTRDALAAENRSELLIPMYLWLMLWFFLACYPIARLTVNLERRWALVG